VLLNLVCHPDSPVSAVRSIKVRVDQQPGVVPRFQFIVEGQLSRIVIPPTGQRRFTDGLWESTCFEVFSKGPNAECYAENNLSPSGDWAAYGFTKYRADMERLRTAPPDIQTLMSDDRFELSAGVALCEGGPPWQLALSAVIEERCGTKSYWALRHPPGKPDFHHKHCFAIKLPPPKRA
jgi:hypothetical protein